MGEPSVTLEDVEVTKVRREGETLEYSGSVTFQVSDDEIDFSYTYEFDRVAGLSQAIEAASNRLSQKLTQLAGIAGSPTLSLNL